jgi:hypothetical protein
MYSLAARRTEYISQPKKALSSSIIGSEKKYTSRRQKREEIFRRAECA